MAMLKVRIELKRTEKGIAFGRLATLANEAQKLLSMIAQDAHLHNLESHWVAMDFYEWASFGMDAVSQAEADEEQVRQYENVFEEVASSVPKGRYEIPGVHNRTVVQFARVVGIANPGEVMRFGFFRNGDDQPSQWHVASKKHADAVLELSDSSVQYHGMIQGRVHSLYKEASPPYFDIRDLSLISGLYLVKCYYENSLYREVVTLLEDKDAVVLVAGEITARRIDRRIESIRVEKMRVAEKAPELSKFIGCAPSLLGDSSIEEFMDDMRNED